MRHKSQTFASRLSRLMLERGFTISKLAKLSNTPITTIYNWKSGVAPTDFQAVDRIATLLNTDLVFLLLGTSKTAKSSADESAP